MIRRVVEYMIHCDAVRLGIKRPCEGTWHAYGARTQKELAESAKREGWKQVSKRYWLCKDCAKQAALSDHQENQQQ